MKFKIILIIFFQNFSFGQIASNMIDVKIENKNCGRYKMFGDINYELKFDTQGILLKRIGYKIKMTPNKFPTDLIETYTYSDTGLPTIILEQEKDTSNKITPRFHSIYHHNEKNQLTEMINFNYMLDSIQQKITFEYGVNGNQTRINKSNTEYIIHQYDSDNKYIKSQLFENNSFVYDLQMIHDSKFLYRDIPDLKTNKNMSYDTYLSVVYLEVKTKIKFTYYKNGIIKEKKTIDFYSNGNSSGSTITYSIKCDGKTKYDKSIIEKINKEILQIGIWQ